MIDKCWQGEKTRKHIITVTRQEVRRYCEVVQEKNRLYNDVAVARSYGYRDVLLPSTYPILFWQEIDIPWLQIEATVVQGEQEFSYKQPLVANEPYHCFIELVRVKLLRGNRFLKHRLFIVHKDDLIATSDTVVVLLG